MSSARTVLTAQPSLDQHSTWLAVAKSLAYFAGVAVTLIGSFDFLYWLLAPLSRRELPLEADWYFGPAPGNIRYFAALALLMLQFHLLVRRRALSAPRPVRLSAALFAALGVAGVFLNAANPASLSGSLLGASRAVSFSSAGGKTGCRHASGRVIVPPVYDSVACGDLGYAHSRPLMRRDGRFGFLDSAGNVAIPPRFEDAGPFYNGLARVRKGGRYGFIDPAGLFRIQPLFDAADDFQSFGGRPLARVRRSGRVGFIDRSGQFRIPLDFDDAGPVRSRWPSNGLATVNAGGRWGLLLVDRADVRFVLQPSIPFSPDRFLSNFHVDSAGNVFFNGLGSSQELPLTPATSWIVCLDESGTTASPIRPAAGNSCPPKSRPLPRSEWPDFLLRADW